MEVASVFSSPSFDTTAYNSHRPRYPPELMQHILNSLRNPPSSQSLAIDLGCGPGTFTFSLLPHFSHVIGIDPGQGMLSTAREEAVRRGIQGKQVEFREGTATNMRGVGDGTVDLITSGTAAHWYPEEWWDEAKRVLRPGGLHCSPIMISNPVRLLCFNPASLSIAISDPPLTPPTPLIPTLLPVPSSPFHGPLLLAHRRFRSSTVEYAAHGNTVTASLYDLLPLPKDGTGWEEEGEGKIKVERKKWLVKEGEGVMPSRSSLKQLEDRLGTVGPVTNWRNSHPEIKSTDSNDIVRKYIDEIKSITGWEDELEEREWGMDLGLVQVWKAK